MKKIVFALLVMFSLPAFSQRVDKPGEPYDAFCKVFCQTTGNYSIYIPNGYEGSLYDKDGNLLKFKDMSDVFTYLSKNGWIYVSYIESNIHLFKKQVKTDEEIKDGLYFKDDFKKKKGGE